MSEPFNINEDAQSGGEFSGSQSSVNDSQPTESSAFPDEDEDTITMLDVIEREDELEEEASAVLGNSDEKNCTYPKGYISRQALYSCATCFDATDKQAAICLACSLECHDNHEVYELYTKRNYRCDCGNSKFKPNFECKLMDKQLKKLPLNENNKYNHNFSGRYCTCDKRFPPEENDDNADDEMWQCIVCEDWYHTKHLGAKELPAKFDELICGQCVDKLDFVHHYKNLEELAPAKESVSTSSTFASVETTINNSNNQSDGQQPSPIEDQTKLSSESKERKSDEDTTTKDQESQGVDRLSSANAVCESDTNDSQLENKDPVKSASASPVECILESLKRRQDLKDSANQQPAVGASNNITSSSKGPLFWSDCGWRSKLCRCQKCLDMYKMKNCEFLLDDKDTVQYYEAQGKAIAKNSGTPFERGMSALNRMNRAAVVEALHGYDELKADLSDYLRKFADTKKVVREEDIHEFFQQLKSKKRARFE